MARILIVDDIEANVDLLEQILEDLYEIDIAHSAAEALEILAKMRPDLILMDVAMPGMSGLDATKAIRSMPRFAEIPIIAVTSHAMRGDRAKALAAGCSDYLTKPVDEDLLLQSITLHLPSDTRS